MNPILLGVGVPVPVKIAALVHTAPSSMAWANPSAARSRETELSAMRAVRKEHVKRDSPRRVRRQSPSSSCNPNAKCSLSDCRVERKRVGENEATPQREKKSDRRQEMCRYIVRHKNTSKI